MESYLKNILKKFCFGYMWETDKEDSYTVTLICDIKYGYMTPKAVDKKVANIDDNIKRVLKENNYEIISMRSHCDKFKAGSFTYKGINDDEDYDFDKAAYGDNWFYKFTVRLVIKKLEEESSLHKTLESNYMFKKEIVEGFTEGDILKSERINDFIEDLYDLRKESITNDGEYGLGNLVFKEFRNLGYLDNLKELKNQEKSKELSLSENMVRQ